MDRKDAESQFKQEYIVDLSTALQREQSELLKTSHAGYERYAVDEHRQTANMLSDKLSAAKQFFIAEAEYYKQPRKMSFDDYYPEKLGDPLRELNTKLDELRSENKAMPTPEREARIKEMTDQKKVLSTRLDTAKEISAKRSEYVRENSAIGRQKAKFVKFASKVTGRQLPEYVVKQLEFRKQLVNSIKEVSRQINVDTNRAAEGKVNAAHNVRIGKKIHLLELLKELDRRDKALGEFRPSKGQKIVLDKEDKQVTGQLLANGIRSYNDKDLNSTIIRHELDVMGDIDITSKKTMLDVDKWRNMVLNSDCRFTRDDSPVAKEAKAKFLNNDKGYGE